MQLWQVVNEAVSVQSHCYGVRAIQVGKPGGSRQNGTFMCWKWGGSGGAAQDVAGVLEFRARQANGGMSIAPSAHAKWALPPMRIARPEPIFAATAAL